MLGQQRAFTAVRPAAASRTSRLSVFARESRIGSRPVTVPKGVTVTIEGNVIKVKGPLGSLEQSFTPYVRFEQDAGIIKVFKTEDTRTGMAQHGLARSLTYNMVTGVSEGFTKKMELVGTGFRASVTGKELTLNVGYCLPRILPIPEGVTVKVEKNTAVTITGYNKVALGDFAANVRRQREPEPYKGKGIRFAGEIIKLKEGKAGGKKK